MVLYHRLLTIPLHRTYCNTFYDWLVSFPSFQIHKNKIIIGNRYKIYASLQSYIMPLKLGKHDEKNDNFIIET